MGKMASDAAKSMSPEAAKEAAAVDQEKTAFSEAAMWPWQMMQQMREQMQQTADAAAQAAGTEATADEKPGRRTKK